MASSSSSHHQNQAFNAVDVLEPPSKRLKVCESSGLFDVFINHRGSDVKQTLAAQLHYCLKQLGIRAFLDSQEKELGEAFPDIIKGAIDSAKVHIAIFSRRYAESPWCLAELVRMLETRTKIIPVFYEVEAWELRHIERGRYADAFTKYEVKDRHLEKLSEWKEALKTLSFIAGQEFHSFSDCENIVAAVQEEVQRKRCLHVDKYPVGLDNLVEEFERRRLDEHAQDFENQCWMQRRKHNPKVVGIFGMGGCGKTTLAKELFNRKRLDYSRSSFLFDVREASVRSELPSLQSQLLKDLFQKNPCFKSIEDGTSYLNDCLHESSSLNFLIVVDDIDHVEQLNALLVMDISNICGNSLIIVTTRDVSVLITAGITAGYRLTGMDSNLGRELFCCHAFGQPHPDIGYEMLVDSFVEVCGGLPLSLKVLGRHVHCKAHSYWQLELNKARTTMPPDVKQRLRISFESLDEEQKKVFMDIACFFVGKSRSMAKRVWEGSGWNAQHALEILKDKCLVEERWVPWEIVLRMHDHLRDLGREMAHVLSPPRRLWRPQDLQSLESIGFEKTLAKTNIRCVHSFIDNSTGSQFTFFLAQSDNFVETSASLLWLQINGNFTELPSIPSWIPLKNLQCLKIIGGRLKALWENGMQAPSQLKELEISQCFLEEFPEFSGISDNLENALLNARGTPFTGMSSSVRAPMNGLEKLKISCEVCVSKILISGMHYPSLQSIKLHEMKELVEVDLGMVKTLSCLKITRCEILKSVSGISDLAKLEKLEIFHCGMLEFDSLCLRGMKCLESIAFYGNGIVKCFELDDCQNLRRLSCWGEKIVEVSIRGCPKLQEMSQFMDLSCLERINIYGSRIQDLTLRNCENLRSVSVHFMSSGLYIYACPELEELLINIDDCPELEESLNKKHDSAKIKIYSCEKLEKIAGIEEVDVPYMSLCYCGNEIIRNRIHMLKSMPSRGMLMVGRAVDGAESSLNENMFREADIDVDGVMEIGTDDTYSEWSELSGQVECFVVVIDRPSFLTSIEHFYNEHNPYEDIELREGKWIITLVACSDDVRSAVYWSLEYDPRREGIMKKGFRVGVKKGEEWKGVGLLRTIVDRLYY